MLILLSPAKTLDESPTPNDVPAPTEPLFPSKAAQLVNFLQQYSPEKLKSVLKDVSLQIAQLNHGRYKSFSEQPKKHAILAYDGPAYKGLQAGTMAHSDLEYAHSCLRILSGLYGIVRPLDAIQPYRLDMGCKVSAGPEFKDLYAFWSKTVTDHLHEELQQQQHKASGQGDEGSNVGLFVVNVASQEYAKAVNMKALGFPVITCSFPGPAIYAKQARGAMARYIIMNRIQDPHELKGFTGNDGEWNYDEAASSESEYVFRRHASKAKSSGGTGKAAGKRKAPAAPQDENQEDCEADLQKADSDNGGNAGDDEGQVDTGTNKDDEEDEQDEQAAKRMRASTRGTRQAKTSKSTQRKGRAAANRSKA